jgi:quercetin dioxygenase-like cupin family protein/hemerythrin-like domain-containing protein
MEMETKAVFGSASELAEFRTESFFPKVLFESERVKVILAGLEPGQEIPLHAPGVDLAVAVLAGVGDLWVDDAPHPVAAGDVAVIPAGTTRGVRARGGRLILLHVVSPPPTAADHALERRPWPAETAAADVRPSLHEEHQELLAHLDHLRALAHEAPELDEQTLTSRLENVVGFLTDVLLPHAAIEENSLYPAVDRLLRATGGATRTMSIDHQEIGQRVERLTAMPRQPLTPATRSAIAAALGALEAVVRLHFRKEEEAYLPLLSRLSNAETADLAGALAAARDGLHQDH